MLQRRSHPPNPIFTAMLAVNELKEAGLVRQGRSETWNRPKLTNPAPNDAKLHGLAMLPAAAEMLRWQLRGRRANRPPTQPRLSGWRGVEVNAGRGGR